MKLGEGWGGLDPEERASTEDLRYRKLDSWETTIIYVDDPSSDVLFKPVSDEQVEDFVGITQTALEEYADLGYQLDYVLVSEGKAKAISPADNLNVAIIDTSNRLQRADYTFAHELGHNIIDFFAGIDKENIYDRVLSEAFAEFSSLNLTDAMEFELQANRNPFKPRYKQDWKGLKQKDIDEAVNTIENWEEWEHRIDFPHETGCLLGRVWYVEGITGDYVLNNLSDHRNYAENAVEETVRTAYESTPPTQANLKSTLKEEACF